MQLPQKYQEIYANLRVDPARYPRELPNFPEMNEQHQESAQKVYGMVSNIDDNLGRILQTLKKNKLDQNTLLIFFTDNGPQQPRYNGGLRNRKGSAYEGGIKVPCLMYFPGRFDPNTPVDVPSAHVDLMPTVLDLCGLPPLTTWTAKAYCPCSMAKLSPGPIPGPCTSTFSGATPNPTAISPSAGATTSSWAIRIIRHQRLNWSCSTSNKTPAS
ncbi:MAG: sulfatase-like hydrolase/transferase [Bacteroidia bacterium]|nr:sulfatase-like hydrolase/transferase [Bacteroidia bacterium]